MATVNRLPPASAAITPAATPAAAAGIQSTAKNTAGKVIAASTAYGI